MKGSIRVLVGLGLIVLINHVGLTNEWVPMLSLIAGGFFAPGLIAFSKSC